MTWTNHQVAELKELVGRGFSCAGVARRMKLTRGQVSNKTYALGLKFNSAVAHGGRRRGSSAGWMADAHDFLAEQA